MKTSSTKTPTGTKVQPVPQGFHTVTPFLMVDNAEKFLNFIEKAFNGISTIAMKDDEGKVIHATARIGNSTIMVGDAMGGYPPITSMLYLYVDNVDELYNQASTTSGAKPAREPRDEFYGDRAGCVEDEWGNKWWIATHIEDVGGEELKNRRLKQMSEQPA